MINIDQTENQMTVICRDISGPEYEWANSPCAHSFACKNQDFDGPFELFWAILKNEGPIKP